MGLKYYLRGLGVGIIVTALIMGIATSVRKETLSDEEIKERARELGMVEQSTVLADTVGTAGENPRKEDGTDSLPVPTPTPKEDAPESAGEEMPDVEETEETPDSKEAEGSVMPAETPEATAKPTATPKATAEATQKPTPSATAAREAEPVRSPEPSSTPEATPTATPAASPATSDQADAPVADGVTIRIEGGESSFTVCKKLEQAGLVESASEYDTYLCQNGYDKRIRAGAHEIPGGADAEQIAGILMKKN